MPPLRGSAALKKINPHEKEIPFTRILNHPTISHYCDYPYRINHPRDLMKSIASLFRFDLSHFKGDFFGGLTAGIVALPLALAFGVSSGLGPSAGLYGAIFVSFFAALFGGTPSQISGPTAPMTAVSMVFITQIIAEKGGVIEKALPIILAVFLLAGLFQILLGMIGIGRYIRYIPYPVVSGFMSAIGVIIILTQIAPSLGYYVKEDTRFIETFKPQAEELILENILREEAQEGILVLEDFSQAIARGEQITQEQINSEAATLAAKSSSGVVGSIKQLPRILAQIDYLELLLAFLTISIIYSFKHITRAVPSTLVALVVVSVLAIGFKLEYRPIAAIPEGLPQIQWSLFGAFGLGEISPYIFTAITLALLGAIDSLLTSVVADNMTKTQHQPNKELVGQGIGNSIGALFGGIPGAGATIRTVVNIQSGGKTRLSGMIAGTLLLTILLAFGPIASQIPAAVLAGILITVGIGVMDYKGLKALPYMPRAEVAILLIVLILSSVWNLVYAVGVGLVIASLMFMKKMGDATAASMELAPLENDGPWWDEKFFLKELSNKVQVKHLEGPLFFGSTATFTELAAKINPKTKVLILRLDRVPYLDQSGLYAIENLVMDLVGKEIEVFFVGVQRQPRYMMERIDLIPDLVAQERLYNDFGMCARHIIYNVLSPKKIV